MPLRTESRPAEEVAEEFRRAYSAPPPVESNTPCRALVPLTGGPALSVEPVEPTRHTQCAVLFYIFFLQCFY
jgi:hypothetical protein